MPRPDAGEAPDQQRYWNSNLDPNNLGGSFSAREFDYESELAFYRTPDQRDALRDLAPVAGKRILEVGVGLGTNALYLAREGATVLGIDIARERLLALRELASGSGAESDGSSRGQIWLVQCSADALPFRDGAFDHAYSKAVLIHTQLEESVPELNRVLCDGGVGVFIEPMTRNPLVNAYRRTLAPKEWQLITRYFAEPEFSVFRGVFARTQIRRYYLTAFLAFGWQFALRAPRFFRVSLVLLNGLDRAVLRMAPSLEHYAWFASIRCEKKPAGEQGNDRGGKL